MNESDWIERESLVELHRAASAVKPVEASLHLQQLHGCVASIASGFPESAIVLNRTIGLGILPAAVESDVDWLLELYRKANVKRYFISLSPQAVPTRIEQWLLGRNLEKARGWQKFSRGREPIKPTARGLNIRQAEPADVPAAAKVCCAAFDLGEPGEPFVAQLIANSGWQFFVCECDGEVAGVGGLFIKDQLAWSDWGATSPRFRQRGIQSALLSARIDSALEQNCKQIYTCTGEAVAGDPQHSYNNILRQGFQCDYVRANYQPR